MTGELSIEAARSVEVEVAVQGDIDGRLADLIDGSRFETPDTRGVIAWCLDLHDPWIAKAIAGREKDSELFRALPGLGVVRRQVLSERLAQVPALDERIRKAVAARISA